MNNKELVVVVGVGPGVGLGVAEAFAKKGHPILLIARSASKLEDLAAGLRSTGVEVSVATADASIAGDVARVVSAISTPISALVYNAAAFGGPLLTAGAEELRKASEVNLYSLISTTEVARPRLKEAGGVVLVTGGGFALFPSAEYGILSVGKAMVRSAAFILAQELKADGIRVATVTICGTVAPDTAFSPDKIAAAYIAAFENQNSEIETIFTGE